MQEQFQSVITEKEIAEMVVRLGKNGMTIEIASMKGEFDSYLEKKLKSPKEVAVIEAFFRQHGSSLEAISNNAEATPVETVKKVFVPMIALYRNLRAAKY